MRWIEASLLSDLPVYDGRMFFIEKNRYTLPFRIGQMKKKKGNTLTRADRELLNILGFLDSLELFHCPHNNENLFNKHLSQLEFESISTLASSDKILRLGGLCRVYSEPLFYTKEELTHYLYKLAFYIDEMSLNDKEPIAILLSGNSHAVGLTYQTGVGWKFMDTKQYPAKNVPKRVTEQLAEYISVAFSYSHCIPIHLDVISTKNNPNNSRIQEAFKNTKGTPNPTRILQENEGADFIHIVARNGHVEVMTTLPVHGIDINKRSLEGYTPISIAAEKGHAPVVRLLAKHGANLDETDIHGRTLAFRAAGQGFVDIISILDAYGADFDKTDIYGLSPLDIAIKNGHSEVVETLFKLGINIYTRTIYTPQSFRNCYFDFDDKRMARVEALLKKKSAKGFNAFYITPLECAETMGHDRIVQLFKEAHRIAQNTILSESDTSTEKKSKDGVKRRKCIDIQSDMLRLLRLIAICKEKVEKIELSIKDSSSLQRLLEDDPNMSFLDFISIYNDEYRVILNNIEKSRKQQLEANERCILTPLLDEPQTDKPQDLNTWWKHQIPLLIEECQINLCTQQQKERDTLKHLYSQLPMVISTQLHAMSAENIENLINAFKAAHGFSSLNPNISDFMKCRGSLFTPPEAISDKPRDIGMGLFP